MRLLSEADVMRLISPEMAIAAAEKAFILQSSGKLASPGRLDIRALPDFRALVIAGLMDGPNFGLKANLHGYASGLARSTASFLTIWNIENCQPRAFIATAAFNDHRTAAGFAAAARALKATNAKTLTIFGAGKIAAPSIRYIAEVCSIDRVHIVARQPGRAESLATTLRKLPRMKGIDIRADLSPEGAARDANIIIAVTTSDTPVLFGEWLNPGTLVILGGANRPHAREADDELIKRAQIYVDHLDGCIDKAGDIRIPIHEKILTRNDIAGEIGSLLSRDHTFEPNPERVVAFKSIGLISQDMVLAEALLSEAEKRSIGVFYDIGNGAIRAPEALPA